MILRPATLADSALLLAWRNDPLTRAMSVESAEIAPDAHDSWLARTLADPNRTLHIAETQGEAIGTVRRDTLPDGMTEFSWQVAPAHRGQGFGAAVLRLALRDLPGAAIARIKPENQASRRMAEAAGFVLQRVEGGLEIWVREKSEKSTSR